MAGIQQSFNQMLMSAQVGTALYGQTPAGKTAAEKQGLKRQAETSSQRMEASSHPMGHSSDPMRDKIFGEDLAAYTEVTRRLYQLDPSDANYQEYKYNAEQLEDWEQLMKASYDKRITTKQDQKEALDLRMKLLEADPNPLNIKKTKVEV